MSIFFSPVFVFHLKTNRTECTGSINMLQVKIVKFKGLILWLSPGHAYCNKRLV